MSAADQITPGPWKVGAQDGNFVEINAKSWGAFASVVVRMDGDDANTPQGEANARAIAQVPALIQALELIASESVPSQYGGHLISGVMLERVRALLATIKGGA